ncbi:prenyltransferase [Candidatus Woesearchaeota archaeon]|nr:prenyltransferase [Candidatus Woesearchaeota archaeon]
MNLQTILKISRPRFWLYLGGTYLVGFVLGMTQLTDVLSLQFVLHLLYFIFFANIFLYGVNDWYDRDTDKYNEKKGAKEHKLARRDDKILRRWLLLSTLLGVILMLVWYTPATLVFWLLWFFLSYFYSAPPLRFKARPLIDSLSNILYVMPGFIAYVQITGSAPPWQVIAAAGAWTAGMHLFSAVPDIAADKQANLLTTAVLLGRTNALWLTTLYWIITVVFVVNTTAWWTFLLFIYPLLCTLVMLFPKTFNLEKVYWFFPYINGFMGFVLFLGGALG